MRLIRFELAFMGERQGVGLFQGLSDVGLRTPEYYRLLDLFSDLRSPVIDIEMQDFSVESVCFWFTPEGVTFFQYAISKVQKAIKRKGWDLVWAEIDSEQVDAIFTDRYQMAVPTVQVKDLMPRYQNFCKEVF